MFSVLWHGCSTIEQIECQLNCKKMSCKTMFSQYNPANEVEGKAAFTVAVCQSVCDEQKFYARQLHFLKRNNNDTEHMYTYCAKPEEVSY